MQYSVANMPFDNVHQSLCYLSL